MTDTALSSLLDNAALLVTLVVVFDLAISRSGRIRPHLRQMLVGVILGCIGIGIILAAFQLESGLIFDTRSVLLAVAGLFLGTVPTLIAMALTAALRLSQGGVGVWMGVAVILSSGLIGLAWRHWRKGRLAAISWRELYGFGVVVHVVMLGMTLLLPAEARWRALAGIGLPVLLIYPLATAALGAFLVSRLRREELAGQLAEKERQLRILAENLPDIVARFDRQFRHLYVNRQVEAVTGRSAADFVGRTNAELGMPPHLVAQWEKALAEVFDTGQIGFMEFHFQTSQGMRDYETRLIPERNEAGEVETVLCINRDITERKQAEAALRDREERLSLAMEAANMGLWDRDLATNTLYWSETEQLLMGFEPGTFPGTSEAFLELIHPDSEAAHKAAQQRVRTGDGVFHAELHFRCHDGRERWGLLVGRKILDETGQAVRIIGVDMDITERKLAEAQLRAVHAEAQLFREAMDRVSAYIYTKDTQSHYCYANQPTLELFGCSAAELVGSGDDRFFPPATVQRLREVDLRVLAGKQTEEEIEVALPDGSKRYYWEVKTPLYTDPERKTIGGLLGISSDITERKLAEAELAHERALMRTLIDQLPDAIYVKDRDSRFLLANESVAHIMGAAAPAALLGKTDADFYPAEMAAGFRADEANVLAGEPLQDKEELARLPQTGDDHILLTTKLPLRDAAGEVIGLVGISRDVTERRQAEAALRRSENLFRSVWENSQDAKRLTDHTGKVLRVNQAYCELFGKPRAEIEGRSFVEVYAPEQQPRILQRYLERYVQWSFEAYMERKLPLWDGREIWLAVSTTLLAADEPAHMVLDVFRDITGRKQAEAALQAARDFYLRVLEEAPALIWRAGLDAKCNWFNTSWLEFTGRTMEQELGDGWAEGVHAEDLQRCFGTYMEAFQARRPFEMEYRLRHHSGEYRWIRDIGQPLVSLTGEFDGYVGYCFDITNLRQTTEALRASEALLAAFIRHSPIYAYIKEVTANDSRVLIASENFRDMIGVPGSAMAGKTMTELFPPEFAAKMVADDQAVIAGNQIIQLDEELGGCHYTTIKFPLVLGERHLLAGYTIDMTERKRLEQERAAMEAQMRHQQKLESIGTLAAGVAHEINNPINGVMNYAQIILDEAGGDAQRAEYAREIIHETERVATIVRNLLQFARQEKQSHSPAQLRDIVEATLSLVRTVIKKDQITLQVELPPDLPILNCRSQQLQQVLMNLFTNARDALNQKHPGYHADKLIRVGAAGFEQAGWPWVRLTVEDRGTGIPEAVRGRVFDPFFSTKSRHEGTGLGLAISHGIVQEHGGKLWFETEPGQWTKFHVELPVTTEEP